MKVRRITDAYGQTYGKDITDEELIKTVPISKEDLEIVRNMDLGVASLDTYINLEEETTLIDMLEDPKAVNPEEEFFRTELEEKVNEALKTLTVREREVIERRFALCGREHETLEEIGRDVGITKEGVRQIEHKALRKLRRSPGIRRLLYDYI